MGWVTIIAPAVISASGSDRHPIAQRTGAEGDLLSGTVLTLTTTELAVADRYEVDDYRRVQVQLRSGRSSWVYSGFR